MQVMDKSADKQEEDVLNDGRTDGLCCAQGPGSCFNRLVSTPSPGLHEHVSVSEVWQIRLNYNALL